jgi:hypothetical protein
MDTQDILYQYMERYTVVTQEQLWIHRIYCTSIWRDIQ